MLGKKAVLAGLGLIAAILIIGIVVLALPQSKDQRQEVGSLPKVNTVTNSPVTNTPSANPTAKEENMTKPSIPPANENNATPPPSNTGSFAPSTSASGSTNLPASSPGTSAASGADNPLLLLTGSVGAYDRSAGILSLVSGARTNQIKVNATTNISRKGVPGKPYNIAPGDPILASCRINAQGQLEAIEIILGSGSTPIDPPVDLHTGSDNK